MTTEKYIKWLLQKRRLIRGVVCVVRVEESERRLPA